MKKYGLPAAIALVVAVLLIVCLWTFKQRTDLDQYRELLIREIERTANIKPGIGRLTLSLSPDLTVHAYDVSLSGIPGSGPLSSVFIPHVEMPVRFLPFLRKRLEPRRVIINSPVLSIQPTFQAWAEATREAAAEEALPAGTHAPGLFGDKPNPIPDLNGYVWSAPHNMEFQVLDGVVHFLSKEGQPEAAIDHVDLNALFESSGRPIAYQGQFRLNGSKVALAGALGPFSQTPAYPFPPFRTTFKCSDFRPSSVLHKLGWSYAPVLEDLPVSLTLDLFGSPGKPLSLKTKAEWTEEAPPFLRLLEGRCEAHYDPEGDILALEDFSIKPKAGPGILKVNGELRDLSRSPDMDLHVAVPRFRANELLIRSGLLAGPADRLHKAFDEVRLNAVFSGPAEDLRLKEGLLQVDGTSCRFNARMRLNFPRKIDFDLHATGLDLDYYLSLPWNRTSTSQSPVPGVAYASIPKETRTSDIHSGIHLSGRIFLEKGILGGLRFSALKTTLQGQNGRLEMNPFGFQSYGGSAQAKAALETKAGVRRFEMDGTLVGIRTSELSRDLTGVEQIRGLAKMGMQLTGEASGPQDLIQMIEGKAWIRMKHGALVGPDILESVRFVENRILGTNAAPRLKVPFRRLEGNFKILNGRAHSDDLLLDGPVLTVKGKGSFGLDQTLDIKITPTFFRSQTRSASKEDRFSLPLHITGSFTNATILPDFGELKFEDMMRTLRGFFMGPDSAPSRK